MLNCVMTKKTQDSETQLDNDGLMLLQVLPGIHHK